jgi:hypothetical protein
MCVHVADQGAVESGKLFSVNPSNLYTFRCWHLPRFGFVNQRNFEIFASSLGQKTLDW